ncbi:hypothetical protein [Emticicia sp. BO119]|uniref:hypothetical protein n=1 Tax=Emticicia sp. BO119 TaxID=2757768 RepID=UPI0015F07C63|nr:hypothetical protein [Emticicia sp. BO119]MBA4848942.1 hypothetical protein [Emticicia sp. BO119]
MLKNIVIIILSFVPLLSKAEVDTLKITSVETDFVPRTAFFEIQLNPNQGKLQNGTLKISTKDDSIGIVLNSKVMANDTIFIMQDSSQNALNKIYSLLGCQESDLQQKYYLADPRYGTVVFNHLINRVFNLPKHQLTLVITPQFSVTEVTTLETNQLAWILVGVLAVSVLVLIILYAMEKSKKPASETRLVKEKIKRFKAELIEERQNKEITDAEVIDILCQRYYDQISLSKDYTKLSAELENTRQNYQNYIAQIGTETEEEKQYFRLISEAYIKPFVRHFKDDTPYPADEETQQKLIGNLIPLAFHFMSFVKLKNKEGIEYDKMNMQQLLNPAFFSSLLKKVDFSANVTNTDNKLVLHIIELLKQYCVSELEKVNINGYIIKNEKPNA